MDPIHGKITNIGEHRPGGNHVRIEIAHGKKSKAKEDGMFGGERPHSTIIVPKDHEAAKWPHGSGIEIHLAKKDHPGVPGKSAEGAKRKENEPEKPKSPAKKSSRAHKPLEVPAHVGDRIKGAMASGRSSAG